MSHQIDSLAYGNRLRWLPPSHKLSFAIVLLILSLISPPIVQAVISIWVFIWIVGYAAIPANIYLKLLALPLSFWIASLPAFVIAFVTNGADGQTPDIQMQAVMADIWQGVGMSFGRFYIYVSAYGLHQVTRLLIRALASTSCMYFILLTTPFTEVLQIFRQLRCPPLLTELLLLMYRFIFTLLAIVDDLWMAQNSRCGYRTWRRGMASLGILIGQLLQRVLLNYRQVSLSLAARGFNGELQVWNSRPHLPSARYAIEASVGCTILTIFSLILKP